MASSTALNLILQAIGTGVKVYSQVEQGKQQTRIAEYNAAVAENNAKAASEKAAFEASQRTREKRRLLSRQAALYGKAGVVTTEGSPLLVMAQTALEEELQVAAIRYGGKVQAQRYRSEAELSRYRGRQYERAGTISAIGTAIGGIGDIFGSEAGQSLLT